MGAVGEARDDGVLDVEAILRDTLAHDDEHLASIERSAVGEPGVEAG